MGTWEKFKASKSMFVKSRALRSAGPEACIIQRLPAQKKNTMNGIGEAHKNAGLYEHTAQASPLLGAPEPEPWQCPA